MPKKDHWVYTDVLSIRKHYILLSYVHTGLCDSFPNISLFKKLITTGRSRWNCSTTNKLNCFWAPTQKYCFLPLSNCSSGLKPRFSSRIFSNLLHNSHYLGVSMARDHCQEAICLWPLFTGGEESSTVWSWTSLCTGGWSEAHLFS